MDKLWVKSEPAVYHSDVYVYRSVNAVYRFVKTVYHSVLRVVSRCGATENAPLKLEKLEKHIKTSLRDTFYNFCWFYFVRMPIIV